MCAHTNTISTLTAGLERVVCEDCGHVSVKYVADTVKIFPDHEDLVVRAGNPESGEAADERAMDKPAERPVSRRPRCGRCEQPAEFMIPQGLACAKHAWAAASRQDALGQELWIPIRIDQNAKASG
jgi:hypothetical protein